LFVEETDIVQGPLFVAVSKFVAVSHDVTTSPLAAYALILNKKLPTTHQHVYENENKDMQ
jgi:hypothetical protein